MVMHVVAAWVHVVGSGSLVNKADEIRGSTSGSVDEHTWCFFNSLQQNTNSINIDNVFRTHCHSPDGISDTLAPDQLVAASP